MSRRPAGGFRRLAVSTAVVTYLLIVMGGIVRVSGSGLGCGVKNDWPLCNGALLPSAQPTAVIEFTHRWIAAVATALVIALALAAWIWQRRHRRLVVASSVAAALFALQIALGALTVEFKLPGSIVMIHLANALLLLGVLVYVAAISSSSSVERMEDRRDAAGSSRSRKGTARTWSRGESQRRDPSGVPTAWSRSIPPVIPTRLWYSVLIAAAFTYVLALSGAFVVENAAGAACAGWPLCGGGWQLPASDLATINVVHRAFAGIAGVLLIAVMLIVHRRSRDDPRLRAAAAAVIAIVLLQVAAGALLVELQLPAPVRGLHIALASGLWALVLLVAVRVRAVTIGTVPGREPGEFRDSLRAPVGAATL